MEQLIENFQQKKAQIAGAIMEEEENSVKNWDRIELLEVQANLYDAMIELAEAYTQINNEF